MRSLLHSVAILAVAAHVRCNVQHHVTAGPGVEAQGPWSLGLEVRNAFGYRESAEPGQEDHRGSSRGERASTSSLTIQDPLQRPTIMGRADSVPVQNDARGTSSK